MSTDEQTSALAKTSEVLMNLFAGLRGKGLGGKIDVQTAVMVPIVAAMIADGRVKDEEMRQIRSVCEFSPIFERNSTAQNEFLIAYASQIIDDKGLEPACKWAGGFLSPALRETAFVHAVRVIFGDGYVGQIEREVVEQMVNWLQIDSSRARMMVEVISVMQHTESA